MIASIAGTIKGGLLSKGIHIGALQRVRETERTHDPRHRFFEIVDDLARQDRIAFHVAMEKARVARPEEFRAAYPSRH